MILWLISSFSLISITHTLFTNLYCHAPFILLFVSHLLSSPPSLSQTSCFLLYTFRFATGGQGKESGMVVVWNMSPVRTSSDETNENVPKYLCELTNHLSCVNCVRWSLDGKWLASGGDDAIIMIWQIRHQGALAGGNSGFGKTTHEQWSCVHMLRGHGSDILDLSWSPDQKFLASCSVDNSIIIWNAKELPQKVTVLSGHQGLVKGITWDPVGKYMASQSDDRSIRIWRVSDWKEVKSVTEPFKRCGGTTHVLRLSWSPDGKYIVSAHALNNDGPTAQIIERGVDWKTGMDFVGHRKAIEVVMFNPHLFVNSDSKDNHGCVALGSRDRSLSVWLTNLKRPLLVMHDLFKDSILDLSWSTDGYELLVCSTDGTVAYLSFSKKELGLRLSKQAFDDLYIQTYGFKRTELESKAPGLVLIENPEMLKLHSSDGGIRTISSDSSLSIKPPTPGQEASDGKGMATGSTSAKSSLFVTQQVETITKEGKRRITPITLNTEPSSVLGAPLPFTSFSPKQNKGTVLPITPESELSKKNTVSSEHSMLKSAAAEVLESDSTSLKPISFEPLSSQNDAKIKPSSSFRKTATVVSKAAQKRDLVSESHTDINLPKAKKAKKKGVHTVVMSSSIVQQKPSTPQKQSSVMLKQTAFAHFPVPKLESSITIALLNMEGKGDIPTIEISNKPSQMSQFSLAYAKGSETIWKVSFSSPCLRATANHLITCITCQDRSMSIYSTLTGRLIVGKLYQLETVLDLKAEDHFLMVMTCSAHISIWDTRKMKAVLKDCSFRSILHEPKLPPDELHLTKYGLPVLSINSNSFIYNLDMECWMELRNSREISEIRTLHFSISDSPNKDTLPLNYLQKDDLTGCSARSDSVGLMLRDIRTSSSAQSCTLTYLESQISRSLCLKSPQEYQHWCKTYVQFLVKDNLEGRLREFCSGFSTPTGRNEIVLGFCKEKLLQEFLTLVAKNPKFQRFYLELREALGEVQSMVTS